MGSKNTRCSPSQSKIDHNQPRLNAWNGFPRALREQTSIPDANSKRSPSLPFTDTDALSQKPCMGDQVRHQNVQWNVILSWKSDLQPSESHLAIFLLSSCAEFCGCGCGRPKLSDVYEPKPKPKPKTSISLKDPNPNCSSSSSCDKSVGFSLMDSEEEDYTSTTITLNRDNASSTQGSESETDPKASKIIDSIAVVKDSNDPFQDFKHSMLQMILEKNIFSKNDLEELLICFLELNSPCHRSVIIQAFTEIWDEIISKRVIKKPCVRLRLGWVKIRGRNNRALRWRKDG
ncbi:hypothetical protein SADUNF_Sadunf09G0130000 [Salix dunnii]|uniref:Transcription repressor n=1 Tax=Salix dunnii TaxID=1413687 RepID=A0A835MSV4_9ROSI|nr:hypothetical protein SADUNF_Sadunf09G0130000 [Salix dunnii]